MTAATPPDPRCPALPRLARAACGGFTLIELIVVMIIIGIMAMVVVPRMDALGSFDARGYADQTEAFLRYAQKSALATRRMVRLELANCTVGSADCDTAPQFCIQTAHSAAPVCDASTACGAAGMTPLALPGQFNSPKGRVRVTGAGNVCFDPMGRPVSGAASITVYDNTGAATRILKIEDDSGYVH